MTQRFATADLFADIDAGFAARDELAPGACVLRGFARTNAAAILAALEAIVARASFRHLVTPGGFSMSVGMTNCGALGWVSDHHGYRYAPHDPATGQPWPPMPDVFVELATRAAREAGYERFSPDACLINRYLPGTRLTLHQDRNEHDLSQPIVSVSLGVQAIFLFGGLTRAEKQVRVGLMHGDVVVWGGQSRLCFHGVLPIKEAHHPLTGNCRINLTFRNVR
ncbi:MAG: DNA oxidative demethylase AlkB [Herminiimonas sp.]|nr:DNA oxidative demethylase AlkB [Herminiimonas sp.]